MSVTSLRVTGPELGKDLATHLNAYDLTWIVEPNSGMAFTSRSHQQPGTSTQASMLLIRKEMAHQISQADLPLQTRPTCAT